MLCEISIQIHPSPSSPPSPRQDLDSSPSTISFSKNGAMLGTAFVLDDGVKGKALFPHIATKNMLVSLNFSSVSSAASSARICPVQFVWQDYWIIPIHFA